MSSQQHNLLDRLAAATNTIDRAAIVHEISVSGDSFLITAMLQSLEQLDSREQAEVTNGAVCGLFETAPTSLDPLLEEIAKAPDSTIGAAAAYILSEVAYKQGTDRDPRILPALLSGLEKTLPAGIDAARNYIYGIRECARASAISAVDPMMIAVLTAADREQPKFNNWYLDLVLEVLAINATGNPDDFDGAMRSQLSRIPKTSYAFAALSDLVTEKEKSGN
jgi:hypothetical protein